MIWYNLFIHIFHLFVQIAAFFHPKARKWVEGRKQSYLLPKPQTQYVWFHCASLGEFEQGRNVMEALKKKYPEIHLLVTFFSPSGYEVRKNYGYADFVMYLPLDTPKNAAHFLDTYQPTKVFFVKYDLWLNMIFETKKRNIPLYLIAARVGERSNFFSFPMRHLYKKAFQAFSIIFTQDEASQKILSDFSKNPHILVSGDPRYDRVYSNQQEWTPIPQLAKFLGENHNPLNTIICGSCWQDEIEMMLSIWEKLPTNIKLIFAPHEIDKTKIAQYIACFPSVSIAFSDIENANPQHRILWIDNVGMLARMYAYSSISFIGGGFHKALHNILEPAAFNNVVLFGNNFNTEKFPEATEMIANGGALTVENSKSLDNILQLLINDVALCKKMGALNQTFIHNRIGATSTIMLEI